MDSVPTLLVDGQTSTNTCRALYNSKPAGPVSMMDLSAIKFDLHDGFSVFWSIIRDGARDDDVLPLPELKHLYQ